MPSLKNFKTKLASKSKKNKTMEPAMPPSPTPAKTPPATKKFGKTAPGQMERTPVGGASAERQSNQSVKFGGGVRSSVRSSANLSKDLSASMRSQASNRTGSMSSLVQIDDHKQLKEVDRPEEPGYSSDPDTSLFEYEDDKEVTQTLKRSMSLRYGSNGALRDSSTESIDTIGMPHGPSSHGLSSHGPEVSEEFIVPTQKSQQDSMNVTIPRSGSPIPSVRNSVPSLHGSTHSIKPVSVAGSLRTSALVSHPGSVRASLENSIKTRTEHDASLRQSVDEAEDTLHEHVHELATLTLQEKQRAISDKQQLDYYRKLEGQTEKTLRDQEELIKRLKARIDILEQLNQDYTQYKVATEQELAEMSEALKAQNKNLEDLVYKLNKEVSYCQTHHQLVKDPNGNKFSGLPGDAPTPAWMVDTKYLSPLIKSLEDQVAMKSQELSSLKRKFAKYEADIRSLSAENNNLREAMKAGGSDPESIPRKTWQQVQQQAALVVQENEVLLEKLDQQDDMIDKAHEEYHCNISQLEDKLRMAEAMRQAAAEQLTDTKYQLQEVKSKHDHLQAANRLKVDSEEHSRVVIEHKTKIEHLEELLENEKSTKLHLTTDAKDRQDLHEQKIRELSSELQESKHDLKRKDKEIRELEETCTELEADTKKGQSIVAKLLLVTDEAVNERQSLKHYLQSEHKDKKKSVNAIIESELMKEKLLASFKKYKIKAEERIDKLMTKLEKKHDDFDVERREYERQIKHLRLMVHEKDVLVSDASKDKKEVEDCLEFVWQATQSDNNDMHNSLRKSVRESRERHLTKFMLNDDKSDVLHFTE